MADMKHVGCGGIIKADESIQYEHEGAKYCAWRCEKCKKEILGDAEIDLEDFDKVTMFKCFPKGTCLPNQHEWPDQPKDQDQCPKCGMHFLTHVMMDLP